MKIAQEKGMTDPRVPDLLRRAVEALARQTEGPPAVCKRRKPLVSLS